MSEYLHTRQTGHYPLSIGTSIAIESLLGLKELEPNTTKAKANTPSIPILRFTHCWINLRTLARNIISSVGTSIRPMLEPKEIEQTLYTEMSFIDEELKRHHPDLVVIYYASDLDLTLYTHSVKRRHTAPIQSLVESLIVSSVFYVVKHFKENPTDRYQVSHFRNKLKPNKIPPQTAVILTHIPYDLLAYKDFKALTLVESHTGAIKERDLWYTKYYRGKELSRLPFNEKLLQIFGDSESFSPLDPKLRESILTVAERYKWTPLTTDDKIRYGIQTLRNKFFIDFFNKL